MTNAQREQVDAFFSEIVELDADARAGAIHAIADPEVRREVASLLAHAEPSRRGLDVSIGALMQEALESGVFGNIAPGMQFERYRIERKLGQGGMGEVYAAVRESDFHKQVALKIVRFGLDSEFARVRFQQERQTLAGLEHPYIARLLDGGEAANGTPYLVLEYVDGVPISEYTQSCTRDQIVVLFLKVCEAVDYAHRNLVIHRDLKPANILVTADGTPKLLDFGIAKLLHADVDATQTTAVALTPQYASPEQVRNKPITTASDVYSLGVILYQLLTNRKPYLVEGTSALELDLAICEQAPLPPGLGNELDDILMMALRKEPERRYPSVVEFSQDLERFQSGDVVLAAPDSISYRARKYISRHWVGLSAIVAIALATAIGAAVSLRQMQIARQRYEQVRTLAHSFVFDYSDDLAKIQGTTAVRERMVTTALRYLDNLSASAGNDLELQKELVASYEKVGDAQGSPSKPNLGQVDAAVTSFRKGAAIGEKIVARDPSYGIELSRFYAQFSQVLLRTGATEEAERMSNSAVRNLQAAASQSAGKPFPELALGWCSLGTVDEDAGRTRKSLESYERCDAIASALLAKSRTVANLKLSQTATERVGTATMGMGHLPEALAILDKDQALIEEILRSEPANPQILRTRALLGQYRAEIWYDDRYPNFDNPARSVKFAEQYLETARGMVAHDEKDQTARFSMAIALFRLSFPMGKVRPGDAVALARESVQTFDGLISGGNTSFLVVSRRNRASRRLAEALLANGELAKAEDVAAEAVKTARVLVQHYPNDFDEQSLLAMNLALSGEIAAAQSRHTDAIRYLTEADRVATSVYDRNPTELLVILPLSNARALLAEQYAANGDEAQARVWSESAIHLWTNHGDQNEYVLRESGEMQKRVRRWLPSAGGLR